MARDDVDFVDEARFPGARWTRQPQRHNAVAATVDGLPDEDLEWLLTDVDVVFTAETPYDYRLFDMARQRGIGTALLGMWEYLPYRARSDLPRPDLFLAPSPWHLEKWPRPCELLPVPVAAERFTIREVSKVKTIVHCAGAFAQGDRAGTRAVMDALPHIRSSVEVVVRSQGHLRRPWHRGPATLRLEPASNNYWTVFDGADAALLPRRYGGLSLPLQEATAQGLPVLGLAREKTAGYDHAAVIHCTESTLSLPCGFVDYAEIDPALLARAIDHLVEDREAAAEMSYRSVEVARGLTWEVLRPRWEAVLGSLTV